jgi:hypothetical protein
MSIIQLRRFPALVLGILILAAPLGAQPKLPPVSVGAGLQTSFVNNDPDGKDNATQRFLVNSARLYINGSATDKIKFMFNTEYNGGTNDIGVLDAVARIEISPKFNIWAGRLLPPSDRANLYGPYYAHHWATFQDGVQDGYPFVATGRDNGAVYWGDFKKLKVSIGAFDGPSITAGNNGSDQLIVASRVQYDFWDAEGGYYLNGTYYGEKNLLAIGGASQIQDKKVASNLDFLLEKKFSSMGVFTIESQYNNYNRLGGYDGLYPKSQGGYVLSSFLFPKPVGPGKFEILGKWGKAQFTHSPAPSYQQKTTEVNFNYVIKEFNARVMTFYKDTRFNVTTKTDAWQLGVGLQIQM